MTEEQKEKYANFLDKVSEILCLNKPVDILRLCTVTDEYFRPIEKHIAELEAYNEKLLNGDIEKHNKIVELQAQISILLSCKNCPENKEGYICQKEYEGKCLAQKTQYIKELKEENAELKKQLSDVYECFISASSGDDFEMAESAREVMEVLNIPCYRHGKVVSKLTKAKEIIKELYDGLDKLYLSGLSAKQIAFIEQLQNKTEQFLKESEK